MKSKVNSPDSERVGWLRGIMRRRTVVAGVVKGSILGAVLAFNTANLLIAAKVKMLVTTVNGWSSTLAVGKPGGGILLRAACARHLPAANVPEEAVYWTAVKDGTGDPLNGAHDYRLHFPPGELPPNHAFWSLTMSDARARMIENPIHRYSLGDRSGLTAGSDGGVDIYIQNNPPSGHESNWLPAPGGDFMLWLRVYQPGETVLNGQYGVPPVVKVK